MEKPRFLTSENLDQIRIDFGTPTFVYDEKMLRANAKAIKDFPLMLSDSFPGMQ